MVSPQHHRVVGFSVKILHASTFVPTMHFWMVGSEQVAILESHRVHHTVLFTEIFVHVRTEPHRFSSINGPFCKCLEGVAWHIVQFALTSVDHIVEKADGVPAMKWTAVCYRIVYHCHVVLHREINILLKKLHRCEPLRLRVGFLLDERCGMLLSGPFWFTSMCSATFFRHVHGFPSYRFGWSSQKSAQYTVHFVHHGFSFRNVLCLRTSGRPDVPRKFA